MIYVMSDIHGEFEKLKKMLKKIAFSEQDTLYILGDLMDRGKNPTAVVQYVRKFGNIITIAGNHDIMAYEMLGALSIQDQLDPDTLLEVQNHINFWIDRNGGGTTVAQFNRLNKSEKSALISFFGHLPLYMELDVKGKHYILVHAGLPDYRPGIPLSGYTEHDLVWTRPDYDADLGDENLRVIVGHTPTILLNGKPEIYRGRNYINIDCGACFKGGRLACLCLDTDEEYYV